MSLSLRVFRHEDGIWKLFDIVVALPDDDLSTKGLKLLLEGFARQYAKPNPRWWKGQKLRIVYGDRRVTGRWNGRTITA